MTHPNLRDIPSKTPPASAALDLPLELQIGYLRNLLAIRRISYIETLGVDLEHVPTLNKDPGENSWLASFVQKYQRQNSDDDTTDAVRHFHGIRDIALSLLLYQTHLKICLFQDTIDCGNILHEQDPLPHHLFSWTREDYFKRRRLENCIWVTVLQKSFTPECLEAKKIKADIESISQFLELMFAAFRRTDPTAREAVQAFISDAYAFTNLFETLKKELEGNKNLVGTAPEKFLALNYGLRDSKNFETRNLLEQQLEILELVLPIEQRYQHNYYDSRTHQHQLKMDIDVGALEEQTHDYEMKISQENFRSQCVMQMLTHDIERYKLRITSMSALYEKDYEAINNEISFKRNTMEKLKEQKKFLLEQIERFKEELEQSRLRILHEEELEKARLKKLAEWRKKLRKSKRRPSKISKASKI